jgi:hypothetical protein
VETESIVVGSQEWQESVDGAHCAQSKMEVS